MKKKWLAAGGLVVVLLAVFGWLWLSRPILSREIRRQVSFVVLYPGENSPAKIDRASLKYNTKDKVLTYYATQNSVRLTVTNQATPEAFVDIPQAYDKVVSGMQPYGSFDSRYGKVTLTRPPNSANQQVAVANARGTLLFVRAEKDLSEDHWKRFFNGLSENKP